MFQPSYHAQACHRNCQSPPHHPPGAIASKLKQFGAIHCMAFSSDGRFLALSRPEAPIDVYEFPAFTHRITCWCVLPPMSQQHCMRCVTRKHASCHQHREDKPVAKEIRQLAFSPAHGNRLLATVDDDGTCILWHWEQKQPLVTLKVGDAGFKQGRFNRCCFGGLHDRRMYTSLNSMGCGWVVVWQQTPQGEIQFVRKVKVCTDALASFEISPHGQFLAVGTTEGTQPRCMDVYSVSFAVFAASCMDTGEVSVFDRHFRRLVRRAGQHTWIVTSIVWAQDSHGMLSIGGDASALVTPVRAQRSASSASLLVALLALLLVLAAVALQVLQPELVARMAASMTAG